MMTQKTAMEETEARSILGYRGDLDPTRLFHIYQIYIDVITENKELDKLSDFIEAKKVLCRVLGEQQLTSKGRFDIKAKWNDVCDKCNGIGEVWKLDKKEVEVDCYRCGATGQVLITCHVCHGSRRYKTESPGLRLNLVCTRCNEEGKALVKCRNCRGHKKIKKPVNSGKILSTTHCKKCDGSGHKPQPPEKPIFNEGMQKQLAVAIREAANEA